MLRTFAVRSSRLANGASASRSTAQWARLNPQWIAAQRIAVGSNQRYFADQKKTDEILLPGSETVKATGDIPPTPGLSASHPNPSAEAAIPVSEVPRTPPTPEQVGAAPVVDGPNPTSPPSQVPLGTGTAAVAPPPLPPKKKRSFARLFANLLILTALGYGIGTYYALVSDNWHDFFTEYVPFGEDIVAYFEEREFRKRFSSQGPTKTKLHEQIRGENKVTIPGRAGITARDAQPVDPKLSDLSSRSGRHLSAVDDSKSHPQDKSVGPKGEPSAPPPAKAEKPAAPAPAPAPKAETPTPAAPAAPVQPISPLTVEGANEPVMQDVIKIVNDIITVINADNAGGKYNTTIEQAKSGLSKVVADLKELKNLQLTAAEAKINEVHAEFDKAAKELLRRQQEEVEGQEMRWREEYENERAKLSSSYEDKLKSELQAANDVHEQKLKNQLLEQSIKLSQQFSETIKDRVESERSGRLSKLDALSSSVQELESLTAEWNKVLDSSLKTQHLSVAVEAVRSALDRADKPTPFLEQLAALKEVAGGDPVIDAAIATINPSAYQKGIPTPSMLVDRFRRVANEVRKAALLPADAGVASHAASLVLSKVMFKKQGIPAGDDVESILSRAEVLLEEGRLEEAAREVNGLQGWAKVLAGDWLRSVREVVEVRNAVDVIATEARLQSLLVE